MAIEIQMPKLAMAMQEGTLMEWIAAEGDKVEKGTVVMVVETEKVTYECEAPGAGLLHIVVSEGTTVDVFTVVALLAGSEAELAELQAADTTDTPQPDAPSDAPAAAGQTAPAAGDGKKVKISPLAKKIAIQNKLDYPRIPGTGPGGRIVKRDVLKALEEGLPAAPPTAWSGETVDGKRVKATVPFAGMRKSIADHMTESLSVSAQLSGMGDVDMTRMIGFRKELLKKEEELGTRISYMDLFILVMVKAVQHVPAVNASLVKNEIKVWEDINVSIAVALDKGEYQSGLVAPVLKNCESKSLTEISKGVKDLVTRARSGALTADDLSHGTITLSNTSGLVPGWLVTTPVLNRPQAILVQPGGIFDKPMAIDGQMVVRPVMTLSVTFDHRLMDGLPAGRFYTKMVELLQQPEYLIL